MQGSKGQGAITLLIKSPENNKRSNHGDSLRDRKAGSDNGTWDLQHTSDSYNSLEESLIPSHLFLRNVWPGYDERAREVEKLRSTTDLRQSLEAGWKNF